MSEIILETERLYLRHIDPDKDFDAIADCYSDDKTMTHIGGKAMDRAQSWRSMAMLIGHREIRGYSFMSVIEKATGAWVGRVGPWNPQGWPEPEVGWTIHRDHWRKGYAKEAAAACLPYVRDQLGWSRVIHVIAKDNFASEKTAEAIGSKRLYEIDHLPGFGNVECWVYGQDF